MSRKIKPNKLFADAPEASIQEDTTSSKDDNAQASSAAMLGADPNAIIGNGRLTAEDAEKIAKYDAMEKSLAAVSEEKAVLEAKIAEYVEKIEALKASADEIAELKSKNAQLEQKCKEFEKADDDTSKLQHEIKSLREENDQYLVKISELTFDNANLTCQLSELEKAAKAHGNMPNQGKFVPVNGPQGFAANGLARPNRDAYNPYVNNGYASW